MTHFPQGWIESMDILNIHTGALLAGLYGSSIVDDTLLQPRSATEGYFMCSKILTAAISKNFKFSSSKFLISPCVTFAGLTLKHNLLVRSSFTLIQKGLGSF